MEIDKKNFDFEQYRLIRERAVGRLFWRLKRYVNNAVEPKLHELGYENFKMSYLMLLSHIEEAGTTNNELAKRSGVSKQMMSKIVGLLEKDGYIYTQKNPNDSRSSIIFLNDRGKELFLALKDCMQQVREKFDNIVGHAEMEQVINTMARLLAELDKEEQ